MEAPIQCQYQWTLDEFIAANKQNRRHSPGARRILAIFWAIALFLLIAGIARTTSRHGFDRISAMLLVGGTLLLVSRLFHRRMLVRIFERMPDRDSSVNVQIFPDQLIIETAAARTETAWSRIASCKRTDEGFLLRLQSGAFYWLPLHGFSREVDIERFEHLIEDRSKS